MTDLIGIFGCGGFGREVLVLLRRQLELAESDAEIVFVDHAFAGQNVAGMQVLRDNDFLDQPDRRRSHVIAIAEPDLRRRLDEAAMSSGSIPFDVISAQSDMLNAGKVGPGLVLCSQSVISVDCTIGRGCHLNFCSYIAHDCVIGDYVTLGPQIACNGNVHIGDGAYIGAGALIRQGKPGEPMRIGEGALIGMGAVVTKDVPAGAVVAGNPARQMVQDRQ